MKKEPIRIAHIVGKWLGGGVEAVVMNYYRNIDHSKIQFDFICDDDSTNIPYDEIKKLGGKVILIPPYQKAFKYHKELKKVLKESNYKIVHSHLNTLSVFPLFAAKLANVPVRIAHSHSTTNKKEWKKNLLKQVLRPFSKVFATHYMCCSELAGRWLFGNKEYDKDNVYLLNNAIDLDKFKYNEKIRKEKRKELNIKDDTLVIGHIGRFVAQKNHDFLIDIFNEVHKQNNNSILLLAGQGPLMDEIKDKVKRLNLEESVKFLGQRNDANELYQAFDIFLLPSLYEGLPVVGVEAQASGLLCFLSSDMTKETKVLESTTIMNLSNTSKEWADNILEKVNKFNRIDTVKEISSNGFNIKDEVSKLEKYYLEQIEIKVIYYCERWSLGGIESLICNYVSKMKNIKFNLLIGQKETDLFDNRLNDNNCEQEVILNNVFESPYKRIILISKKMKKILSRNDKKSILHFNIYNSIGLFYAYLAMKCGYKKIVVHAHNNGIDNDKLKIKLLINNLCKLLFDRKKYVHIACSQEAAKFCFNSKKYVILENGIDFDNFYYDSIKRKKIREELNINDKLLIGNVGRFVEQKNHLFLLDVFYELLKINNDALLLIIGKGPLEFEINKKIDELNIRKNIIIIPETNHVQDYFNAMDFFVFPSNYEGFGLVLVEAQISGLSCLASDRVPITTCISSNVKYMDITNPSLWADYIIKNSFYENRNIEKNIEHSIYNLKNVCNKLLTIYIEVGEKDE